MGKVDKLMPKFFQRSYPSTLVIVDCVEFFINTPDSLTCQSATFSEYKSHNTVKCMIGISPYGHVTIGISPHGHVTIVLPVFEGSASDRHIVEESGLLDLLERGDSLTADKGFQIQDLCTFYGVGLTLLLFGKETGRCFLQMLHQ